MPRSVVTTPKKPAPQPKAKPRKKRTSVSKEGPNPMDIHVGQRLRLRREVLGITQKGLAEALGLTFQQVQKYERGTNRVSASRLHDLSVIFKVDANFFFEDFNMDDPARVYGHSDTNQADYTWLEEESGDLMQRRETIKLVQTYYAVQDQKLRQNYLKMLQTLVSSQIVG